MCVCGGGGGGVGVCRCVFVCVYVCMCVCECVCVCVCDKQTLFPKCKEKVCLNNVTTVIPIPIAAKARHHIAFDYISVVFRGCLANEKASAVRPSWCPLSCYSSMKPFFLPRVR